MSRCLFLLLSLIAVHQAAACSVPVFRYALERWPADSYELRAAGVALPENLSVNLTLTPTNAGPARLFWNEREVWSGELTANTLAALIDSPVRREMVQRIIKGDSAVWLLLESGDKTKDDRAAATLATELPKLEKELELPAPDPNDPRINPNVPLKIAFSILRLARNGPAEQVFTAMLLNSLEDAKARSEPVVFPVFGRGRALCALVGHDINPDNLAEIATFVTGACSCEVKAQNPGKDLLIAADWDALLEGQAVKDPPMPPLVGLGHFGTEKAKPVALKRNLVLVIGLAALVVVVGTIVLVARRPQR